jgi:hypothetical protein
MGSWTGRTGSVAAALVLALASAGCAGRRGAPEPCGPVCVVEHRRAPCCRVVTIPERCERRLVYDAVPADCRTREMPEYGICQRTTVEDRCVPVTQPVEVCETCPLLVPTYERVCVATTGYQVVQEYEDRLRPRCCPRLEPVFQDVLVPDCGCVCDCDGDASWGTIGCHPERRHAGYTCRMQKVGEDLVSVNVGERLEQVVTGMERVCVPNGSRTVDVVVGTRIVDVPVGGEVRREVVDRTIDWRQTGTRTETIVKRPCSLRAREETVRVPGYQVRVCDDPRHRHEGPVISSEQYASLTGKTLE